MNEENKSASGFNIRNVVILVLVVALIWVIWSNYGTEEISPESNANQVAAGQDLATTPVDEAALIDAEIDALLEQFSRHIVFPTGERPELATITDAEELTLENPFFINSQDGDKVLVYLQVGKAYVLSPARNLVVNVGPIVNEEPTSPLEGSEEAGPVLEE